jgi:hypothetical protein
LKWIDSRAIKASAGDGSTFYGFHLPAGGGGGGGDDEKCETKSSPRG